MKDWKNLTEEEFSQLGLDEAKEVLREMIENLPDEVIPEFYEEFIKTYNEYESK